MGSGDADGKAKAFIVIVPEQTEVYSLDIVFGYDASGISPVAVNKLTSIADWLLSTNLNTPGTIRLGLAGATPLAATAAVIEIEFSVSKPVENDSLQPLSAALNEVSTTSNFLYDQAAPVLTITAPADNGKTKDAAVAVAGTVDEIATVVVSLNNGALQTVMMTGKSFSLPLTLASGANTIDISATDLVGNRGTVSRTVTYDALPPALAITNPSQDTTTNQNNITI